MLHLCARQIIYNTKVTEIKTHFYFFALGNEAIHLISTNGKHKLHIGLEMRDGSRFYADYSLFRLNNESSQYLLNVTGYSGTAGRTLQVTRMLVNRNFKHQSKDNCS